MEQCRVDLNEIMVFTRVVQTGSFTAAAKALGMPKSTVSRKVSELEARLESRLLQRTTRKLGLTDAGRTYFDYGVRIVTELEEAERAVGDLRSKPRGLLRITAGVSNGFLAPVVASFLARYPDVEIEMLCTARAVDLVEERYDVAIRNGPLADSSLVARSLGSAAWFLVATPAYLKRRGRPRSPDDLKKHDLVMFVAGQMTAQLRLVRDGAAKHVAVQPRLAVSDIDIAHTVALAGIGIALLPAFQCIDDLRARRFERVLRDWSTPPAPVHIVYPTSRHVSPKVKAFVEHVQQAMTPPPWELGPMP
jgi:DNA-binding transcriptional LysR family regulator